MYSLSHTLIWVSQSPKQFDCISGSDTRQVQVQVCGNTFHILPNTYTYRTRYRSLIIFQGDIIYFHSNNKMNRIELKDIVRFIFLGFSTRKTYVHLYNVVMC